MFIISWPHKKERLLFWKYTILYGRNMNNTFYKNCYKKFQITEQFHCRNQPPIWPFSWNDLPLLEFLPSLTESGLLWVTNGIKWKWWCMVLKAKRHYNSCHGSRITCSGRSQPPCHVNTQVALWRSPCGEKQWSLASSQHQFERLLKNLHWNWILQPQLSPLITAAPLNYSFTLDLETQPPTEPLLAPWSTELGEIINGCCWKPLSVHSKK